MPVWLVLLVAFYGSFMGTFLASAFYVSKREDDRNEECGNGESAN